MACLFPTLSIIVYVLFAIGSGTNTNTSSVRTTYTYDDLPSTWLTKNPVDMDGWKMKIILSTKGFYFGFYCSGNCITYSLSVVAVGGGRHSIVWSANPAVPLRENAALYLWNSGFFLHNSDGTTVWSLALNQTTVSSLAGLNLTEAGNLIVFDRQSAMVWQSFDNPVDALLVGQRLYRGQRLVPSSFETPWRESPFFTTLATGAYLSGFISTSGGKSLKYYQLELKRDMRNRSGLQYVEEGGTEFIVNVGSYGASNSRKYVEYVKLGLDGHLRAFWHDVDGSNSSAVDIVAQGCVTSPSGYRLTEVSDITYSSTSRANDSTQIMLRSTMNECKEACLKSCTCTAVVFSHDSDISDGRCYMPSEIFSVAGDVNNQSNSLTFAKELNNSMAKDLPPTQPSKDRKNLAAIVSASTASGLIMIILILVFLVKSWKSEKDRDEDENLKVVPGMPSQFSYKDLLIATENFKEILGSGGFGSVFKGVLPDGTSIAVKRLDKMSHGMREFLAEVETIGRLHHFNLVRLVGFCAEKSSRLLVYEYMTNGSLDNWIFCRDQEYHLDWETRKKIILDVAKGLTYLHEDCRQKIIHLDIKPHNILLDENFNAKVSDFGLSALIERDESQVLTKMRGTPGYLAPEWKELSVSVKVDVYSFGIVLLEIISQRKNVEISRSETSFHLLKMLQKKAEEDRLIEVVESLDIDMENNVEEVVRMIRIGAWCLQDDPEKRPCMSTVVKVLEGVMEVDKNISYKFYHAPPSVFVANDRVTLTPKESILSAPR